MASSQVWRDFRGSWSAAGHQDVGRVPSHVGGEEARRVITACSTPPQGHGTPQELLKDEEPLRGKLWRWAGKRAEWRQLERQETLQPVSEPLD